MAEKNDIDSLQGAWSIKTLEMDGHSMPGGGAKITVKGERFITTGMGATYEGTLEVDATQNPKTFNLHFNVGPEAGNTSYGIYEFNGDAWRICLTTRGSERPKEFATKPGTGIALEVLERESGAS